MSRPHELEKQALNRLDFQSFLGYPEQPPDYSTVWSFRERLAATGTDKLLWAELQRQLDERGLKVRKGVAQDASIIEADPGPSGKPRGDDALTRRSRDGDWALRLKAAFSGFKLHVKTDLDHGLVRAVEATSASVHDSRVDLSEPGEVVYRDKGYFGVAPRGFDSTTIGVAWAENDGWEGTSFLRKTIPLEVSGGDVVFRIPDEFRRFYGLDHRHHVVSVNSGGVLITVSGEIRRA